MAQTTSISGSIPILRPSPSPSHGLTWWYAVRDLTARGSRRTTVVNCVTIAMVTAVTLEIFGLFGGYVAIREHRILRDPLSRCIWLGEPHVEETRIPPETLDKLRQEISAALSRENGFRGCYPFHEVKLMGLVGGEDGDPVEMRGRTLVPGDPLLMARPLRPQPSEDDAPRLESLDGRAGVVVTPRLLEELHLDADAPPEQLWFRVPSGSAVQVPLLGVMQRELPLGYLYVMSQQYLTELLGTEPNASVMNVMTGPLGKGWPDPASLPSRVLDTLDTYGIAVPQLESDGSAPVWLLRSRTALGMRLSEWHTCVRNVHQILIEAGQARAAQFEKIQPLGVEKRPLVDLGNHHRAVVYVYEARHLKPARDAAIGCNVYAVDSEDTLENLERLDAYSRKGILLLSVVVVLVVAMAFCNLFVIQEMRAAQKVEEIGMLKAMGMTTARLRDVYAAEAFLIWAAGFFSGTAVAWLLGRWCLGPAFLAEASDETALAFQWGWNLIPLSLGISLALILVLTRFASSRTIRKSPIETLAAN